MRVIQNHFHFETTLSFMVIWDHFHFHSNLKPLSLWGWSGTWWESQGWHPAHIPPRGEGQFAPAPFLSLLSLFFIICINPFFIIFIPYYLHHSFLYYIFSFNYLHHSFSYYLFSLLSAPILSLLSLFFIICIIPFFIINLFSIAACYWLYGWRTNFHNLEAIWSWIFCFHLNVHMYMYDLMFTWMDTRNPEANVWPPPR